MADGRHFENSFISTSLPLIIRRQRRILCDWLVKKANISYDQIKRSIPYRRQCSVSSVRQNTHDDDTIITTNERIICDTTCENVRIYTFWLFSKSVNSATPAGFKTVTFDLCAQVLHRYLLHKFKYKPVCYSITTKR